MWKLADFGLTTEMPSRTMIQLARGTPGYRAPELLLETPHFNNKVDIWAMGCIVYEVATGRKAFVDDWAVRNFMVVRSRLYISFENCVEELEKMKIRNLVSEMLRIKPKDRLNLRDLYTSFCILSGSTGGEESAMSKCLHYYS